MSRTDSLQGTLPLLVLTILDRRGPLHGYGITEHIESLSDVLRVEEGSLYPALHRMEEAAMGGHGSQSPRPPVRNHRHGPPAARRRGEPLAHRHRCCWSGVETRLMSWVSRNSATNKWGRDEFQFRIKISPSSAAESEIYPDPT
jgi:Transcriptional regulator PadR-like family